MAVDVSSDRTRSCSAMTFLNESTLRGAELDKQPTGWRQGQPAEEQHQASKQLAAAAGGVSLPAHSPPAGRTSTPLATSTAPR